MPKSQRSRAAKIQASFGRSERLKREAGDMPQAKPASRQHPGAARPERAAKLAGRRDLSRPAEPARKPALPRRIEERLERSRAATERQRLLRLQQQARGEFNREGERRRDMARRAEHDRKHDALQAKERRLADHQRRANLRRLERKRGEMRREFARAAERRDVIRRAHADRLQAQAAERQKELQRRAAMEVDREQKRRALDQQAAQRRQTDAMRARHRVERASFRDNQSTALERHHHAIKGIDEREARDLADFDGRRKGLAGRAAELVLGRRAENDRQREGLVRGYESERLAKHRAFEALKERQFEREQQAFRDHALERKALMALHRDERAAFGRDQLTGRPRRIEDRARAIERTDRAHEQERERAAPVRESVRLRDEFGRVASGDNHDPRSGLSRLTHQHRVFERA